jgi:hypothetical protein
MMRASRQQMDESLKKESDRFSAGRSKQKKKDQDKS